YSLRFLIVLTISIGMLFSCAAPTRFYLTPESQQIKDQFWSSDLLLYGYLMEGTKYQIPIFHFNSEKEGTIVMILGGTHGNEPAGFEAAYRLIQQFSDIDLKSGEIFIVPESNRIADSLNKRRIPVPKGVDIEKGNLNRCYPGNPDGLPMEQLAYQITQFSKEHDIDLFLDLHESPKFHLESKDEKGSYKGLGQTLIYTPNDEATWLAMVVADEMNSSILERKKQFSLVERPIESSAAWSAGEHFGIPAFTVETCKQLTLEERVHYQVRIVNIILREQGII
ncbi:MAG: succinylglutamate desuccinylase/aspartoacylase family protein, partial [bacterium]